MNNDIENSKIEQVYDDFAHHKGEYDEVMEDAINDVSGAIKSIKNRREGYAISDDIAALMEDHGAKFGEALNTAAEKDKTKWVPQLAEILTAAIDANPDNTEILVKSALEMEKAYNGADAGVLLNVAEKAAFRHPEKIGEVLPVVDEHLQSYEAQNQKDAATYKAFYKVYTTAVRKTRNQQISQEASAAANEIFGKIEVLKGNVSVEKLLALVKANPGDEATLDTFEQKLNMLMAANPKAGAEDIVNNLKGVSKIEDETTRDDIYNIAVDVLGKHIKANTPEEAKNKSGLLFSAFDAMLKAEKNSEVRKNITVSAVNALSYMAAKHLPAGENAALIIDDDKKQETFRSLKRMAESYGHYVGFRDLLAGTAAKYGESAEIVDEMKNCMLKALVCEDRNGGIDTSREMSPLEKEVLVVKKEQDLEAQIFALLNVPHKSNKYQKDPQKPDMPSKDTMREVADLLGQYKNIEYKVTLEVLGKIDKEKFSNVDDAIIDKLEKNIEKMQYGKDVADELTGIRTQMHKSGIQQKKADNTPKQWHETKQAEPVPNKRISVKEPKGKSMEI